MRRPRSCTLRGRSNRYRIPLDDVFSELERLGLKNLLEGLQRIRRDTWVVTVKLVPQLEDFISTVNEESTLLECEVLPENQRGRFRIEGLPVDYKNQIICAHLEPFLEDFSVEDETYKKERSIKTGVRIVTYAKQKKPLHDRISFGRYYGYLNGIEDTKIEDARIECRRCRSSSHVTDACDADETVCFECNMEGHRRADCPRRLRCAHCHEQGHDILNCELAWNNNPVSSTRVESKPDQISGSRETISGNEKEQEKGRDESVNGGDKSMDDSKNQEDIIGTVEVLEGAIGGKDPCSDTVRDGVESQNLLQTQTQSLRSVAQRQNIFELLSDNPTESSHVPMPDLQENVEKLQIGVPAGERDETKHNAPGLSSCENSLVSLVADSDDDLGKSNDSSGLSVREMREKMENRMTKLTGDSEKTEKKTVGVKESQNKQSNQTPAAVKGSQTKRSNQTPSDVKGSQYKQSNQTSRPKVVTKNEAGKDLKDKNPVGPKSSEASQSKPRVGTGTTVRYMAANYNQKRPRDQNSSSEEHTNIPKKK